MSTVLALPVLLGTVLALGLYLVWTSLALRRGPGFADRMAPQLRATELVSALLADDHRDQGFLAALTGIFQPALRSLGRSSFLHPEFLDTSELRKRLVRAGMEKSPMEFRAEQLAFAAAGTACAFLLTGIGWLGGLVNPFSALFVVLAAGAAGFTVRDWMLTRTIRRREQRMLAEFPAIAELMALSVTAGESATASLERVCRCSQGELTSEFHRVLASARSGRPIAEALHEFAVRIDLPPLSRFVDGITVAIERGTPLADVLRSQAQDVRDQAKRGLMETAGKKEIAMMAPVVFLILPLTVLFAVYPGLAVIDIGL